MLDQVTANRLVEWALQHPLVSALSIVASLLLIGMALGTWSKRRRSDTFLSAFEKSMGGTPLLLRRPDRRGFIVAIRSQVEPFLELKLRHEAVSYLDPRDLFTLIPKGIVDQVIIEATLLHPPHAELIWHRGHIPRRALGAPGDAGLWVRRRLDIISSEYVVRGSNTRAIEHSLLDLQNRFGPFMQRVTIQADIAPHLEIVLHSSRLSAEEVPALLHLVQGAGRASLLR